jgi:peptide deformylase
VTEAEVSLATLGAMAAEGDAYPDEPEIEAREQAESEVRRRLALAQIRQYPDAVLRMRAHEVDRFDETLARLAERMTELMHDARGVGLAATQVGVLQRLFVFQADEEDEVRAVVNPQITARSEELESGDEGCLSLQGVLVPVERSLTVTLEGQDLEGKPLRLELEELPARVVQHELDHLDGTLMIERTDPESRREALATLRHRPSL